MIQSKVILFLCLSFVIGIFLNSLIKIPQLFSLGVLILAIILISVFWLRNKKIVVLGFCLLVLASGVFRYEAAGNRGQVSEIEIGQITFEGIVAKEPEIRIDKMRLVVEGKQIGRVLVTAGLYPKFEYGDKLEIKGQLKTPIVFDDFNYREYLAKDGIYSVIYSPQITLLAKNKANPLYQLIFDFKGRLRNVIEKTLLPPQSSILKAIFLGDKYILSDDLKEKLNITGTRHIAAISGMHMVIMAEVLLFLALAIGLWRGQAFYFVLIFLFLYIIMIGAPASAIRAGIMTGLLLLAQKVGRLRSADRAVVFAATGMLIANPLLLEFDVGFQLSFAAVLSIIYLKPILDKTTENWPNPFRLKDILTMTLAAQLGALPILIFHFGRLSLISPIANLLIVPFLPAIMISGLILSLVGLIYLPIAKIIAWPVWLLLTYMIKIIDWLSTLPLAAFEIKNTSWVIMIGYYAVLAAGARRVALREREL